MKGDASHEMSSPKIHIFPVKNKENTFENHLLVF